MNELMMDALKEIINIGIGKSAAMLNSIVKHHIYLEVPELHYISGQTLLESKKLVVGPHDIVSSIQQKFKGGFTGEASILFPIDSSTKLINIVIEDTGSDFDSLKAGALTEIGNVMINGVVGSISNILKQHIQYTMPFFYEGPIDMIIQALEKEVQTGNKFLVAEIKFVVESLKIEGDFILFFEMQSFETLLKNYIEEPMV